MPSNTTYVCFDCRVGGKAPYPRCVRDNHRIQELYKISIPRKNNDRAWRRMEAGELKWNRRKSRGKRGKDTITKFEHEWVECPENCDCLMCSHGWGPVRRKRRVPGSGKEVDNPRRLPDVDLGG